MTDEPDVSWCCDELQEMTYDHRGRYGGWSVHIAEIGFDGRIKPVWIHHVPNNTITNTLEPDHLGDEFDFTMRYCPFCGADVTELTDTEKDQ